MDKKIIENALYDLSGIGLHREDVRDLLMKTEPDIPEITFQLESMIDTVQNIIRMLGGTPMDRVTKKPQKK